MGCSGRREEESRRVGVLNTDTNCLPRREQGTEGSDEEATIYVKEKSGGRMYLHNCLIMEK